MIGLHALDLSTHQFGIENTWVISAFPDNENQWLDSANRRDGLGQQGTWKEFSTPYRFGEKGGSKELNPGHLLENAEFAAPEFARKYCCYSVRQKQFKQLSACGLRVKLGARRRDFVDATLEAFRCGGLVSLLCHFDRKTQQIEFTDGFLKLKAIADLRSPGGFGVLDARGCEISHTAPILKSLFGPLVLIVAAEPSLVVHGLLLHRLSMYESITKQPAPLAEHMLFANRAIRPFLQHVLGE